MKQLSLSIDDAHRQTQRIDGLSTQFRLCLQIAGSIMNGQRSAQVRGDLLCEVNFVWGETGMTGAPINSHHRRGRAVRTGVANHRRYCAMDALWLPKVPVKLGSGQIGFPDDLFVADDIPRKITSEFETPFRQDIPLAVIVDIVLDRKSVV